MGSAPVARCAEAILGRVAVTTAIAHTPIRESRSLALTPYNRFSKKPANNSTHPSPRPRANHCKRNALLDQHRHQIPRTGTKRHPHTEFMHPHFDGIRDYSIDADRSNDRAIILRASIIIKIIQPYSSGYISWLPPRVGELTRSFNCSLQFGCTNMFSCHERSSS